VRLKTDWEPPLSNTLYEQIMPTETQMLLLYTYTLQSRLVVVESGLGTCLSGTRDILKSSLCSRPHSCNAVAASHKVRYALRENMFSPALVCVFVLLVLVLEGWWTGKQCFKCPYQWSVYPAGSWMHWQMATSQRTQEAGSSLWLLGGWMNVSVYRDDI